MDLNIDKGGYGSQQCGLSDQNLRNRLYLSARVDNMLEKQGPLFSPGRKIDPKKAQIVGGYFRLDIEGVDIFWIRSNRMESERGTSLPEEREER